MTKGRLHRNIVVFLIGIIAFIVSLCFKVQPAKIKNYTELVSGFLTFSTMATGFLVASFALIPALPNSKLIIILKNENTDLKLLDRLLITIIGFLLSSLLSLILLLFSSSDSSCLSEFVFALFLGVFTFSIVESFLIIYILLKVIDAEYKEEKK